MTPEDLLARTFTEVTETTEYPSTPILAIAARARAVRRRRRRTATLAAAAAVALVVTPAAVWLHRSPDTSSEPTKSPTSTATTNERSLRALRELRALPQGPRPGLDYVAGNTYVGVTGQRLRLPSVAIAAVPARGGGLLVFSLRSAPGPMFDSGTTGTISQVDQPGSATKVLGCGSQGFAVSADRTQAAYWLMNRCRPAQGGTLYAGPLSTMGESGQPGTPTPPGMVVSPVGFLGSSVVGNSFPTGGTDVSVDGAWIFGSGAPHRIPGLRYARAVTEGGPSGDLVAGDLIGGGSAVVDPTSGDVLWTAPRGWSIDAFSLDGRYVVAGSTVDDATELEILDATNGHLITVVPEIKGTDVYGEKWGEDGSLMVEVAVGHASTWVRCTTTGALSRATTVVPGHGHALFYGFGTNP